MVSTLAVGLCFQSARADALTDFESLFGKEAKRVALTRTKSDDAEFAAKLIKSAREMPDSPALQVLLYEKACEFGATGTAGCDTALEALELLERAVPQKKSQWQLKRLDIVKFQFDRSRGPARKAAGMFYMEVLEAVADARAAEGKGAEAKALYTRAFSIATYVKSDRTRAIIAKKKRIDAMIAQDARINSLRRKLELDSKDTTAREALIILYIVGLDKPQEAAKLLRDDLDESTRTYVTLASKGLDALPEAACVELGDWYFRTLFGKASLVDKPVALKRAKAYYEQFLKLHTKKDIQSFRARAALERIEKELAKLGAPAGGLTGKTLTLNLGKKVTMKFVRISAGKFLMGSPKSEKGRQDSEGPQHTVTISKPFYMGVTEVTQAQYAAVMGKDLSVFKGPNNPADKMSWMAAAAFCKALSKKTSRTVRLPTEAQWEYACRAGTRTRFSFGDDAKDFDAHGWSKANSGEKIHPTGQKKPNPAGLYDMHGNVWESCSDWYDEKFYAKAKNVDPENTTKAKHRVIRGGSWHNGSDYCRAASRLGRSAAARYGFRVVVLRAAGH